MIGQYIFETQKATIAWFIKLNSQLHVVARGFADFMEKVQLSLFIFAFVVIVAYIIFAILARYEFADLKYPWEIKEQKAEKQRQKEQRKAQRKERRAKARF